MPKRFFSLPIRQSIGYFLAFIALGLYISTLGPTLPYLAEQTLSSLDQISVLFVFRSMGYLLGSLFLGRSYDRLPGHWLMALFLLLMGVMTALAPVVSLLWLLAGVMFLLGIGEGALDVGGNTLLVWVHGSKVGPFMNGLHFFFGVGAFISPILIAQTFLLTGGIKAGYWILAVFALPVALWLITTPAPHSGGRIRERSSIVDASLITLIALFYFLYVGAEASFGGWVFTYTLEMGLSGSASAAYLTSAFWGALTCGRLLAIPIASRARPRTILLACLTGCLISVGIILIFPGSINAIWMGTIGMGLSMAPLFPTMFLIAERRMMLTGKVTRWFFVGAGIGGMFLPWLIGQLFVEIGPKITMQLIAIDLVLAFVVLIRILGYPLKDQVAQTQTSPAE